MSAPPTPTSNGAKPRPGVPSAISADLLRPVPRAFNALLVSLVALVVCLFIWSAFATLEEITRGVGRVIPATKIQVVQNLEGGIVRDIFVREGQMVARGDVLLHIDPTQANASVGEAKERIAGLAVMLERLHAEVAGRELVLSETLAAANPELVSHEQALFQARRNELNSAIRALEAQERQRRQELLELEAKIKTASRSKDLVGGEVVMLRRLAKSRAASQSELLAAETKLNDVDGELTAAQLAIPRVRAQLREVGNRINEKTSNFRADALQKLSQARVELSAMQEAARGDADKLARTTVRATAKGIVKTVHVTTVGQVVQPGHNLVEIVPIDDALLIEARVKPRDIAFLRPGLKTIVKLTAYDFSIYGGLEGELEHIGADSITDEDGETYYLIRVRTDKTKTTHPGSELNIIPGMVAEVDVLTGQKTVLAYLTKPLTRMRHEALRER